jgi:hypothetical protein
MILRVLANGLVLAVELGIVAGATWLGLHYPVWFAVLTAGLALCLGLWLEYARLKHELPFYFGRVPGGAGLLTPFVALVQSVVGATLAGLVALMTFTGTDPTRLYWVAIAFAVGVFAGSSLLRRLAISFGAEPSRWGYFRLAVPLGLLFSLALALLPSPSFADVGLKLIFDLPARPTIAQASEVLFVLKQKFDDVVAGLLSYAMPREWARIVGALASVNVMSGFVIAIYAVVAASVAKWLDERLPSG